MAEYFFWGDIDWIFDEEDSIITITITITTDEEPAGDGTETRTGQTRSHFIFEDSCQGRIRFCALILYFVKK